MAPFTVTKTFPKQYGFKRQNSDREMAQKGYIVDRVKKIKKRHTGRTIGWSVINPALGMALGKDTLYEVTYKLKK